MEVCGKAGKRHQILHRNQAETWLEGEIFWWDGTGQSREGVKEGAFSVHKAIPAPRARYEKLPQHGSPIPMYSSILLCFF